MKNNILLLLLTAMFSSCLKSDEIFPAPSASGHIVLPASNWPLKESFYSPPPLDSALGTTTLNIIAGITFEKPLDKAIRITFKKDDAVSDAFNTYWTANFQPYREPLPDNCYTINSLELTIPAGSSHAALPVTLKPQNFSGTDNYIISFTIVSSTGGPVAENLKSIVYTLQGY